MNEEQNDVATRADGSAQPGEPRATAPTAGEGSTVARNDGGPAFPVVVTSPQFALSGEYGNVHSIGGISIRDYFAGQALIGLASGTFCDEQGHVLGAHDQARCAYELADAMVAAREAK